MSLKESWFWYGHLAGPRSSWEPSRDWESSGLLPAALQEHEPVFADSAQPDDRAAGEAEAFGPVPILAARHGQCRWPLWNDPDEVKLICGEAAVAGCSYCHKHLSLSQPRRSGRPFPATPRRAGRPAASSRSD